MDNKSFDAITRLAANAPDRRNVLKLAGAAAVAGTAGFLARADDAEAGLITLIVTNVLNDLTVNIPVKNNNVAVQICAAIEVINVELFDVDTLVCEIEQTTGGGKEKS